MTISRRTIIKGMAAAPLAAVGGGLVAPAAAEAAVLTPGRFTLTERLGNGSGTYAAQAAGLAGVLPKATVADVLASANRDAVHLTGAPSGVGAFADGFAWNPGDQGVAEWVPQGVTTSADALGSGVWGGKRVVLVSWYFDTDPDGDGVPDFPVNKGVRVSFVDHSDPAAPRYRHVLLVEPMRTAGGAYSYAPVQRHAGGILWYGNLLYMVDTTKGLRVFDLDTVFEVATGKSDVCGLDASDGRHYAYDYRYVLPQSGAYDNTGTLLRFSCLGLDRASTPDSLTVSEYAVDLDNPAVDYTGTGWNGDGTKITTPKIVRWNLDYTNRKLGSTTASEAVTVRQGKIQGTVAQQSRHYLSTSNGGGNGTLHAVTSGTDTPSTVLRLAKGCEDLSFHSSATTDWKYAESVIWNLSEYAGSRYVYAVRAAGS
ncbi:hypothetical protein [Streptomyces sp. CBMA156]|uniref:hypothetical protein n=1 Tax=Streptomyces sp. CBMA156 TaxID=1930280 RepID=UPI0016620610|nr:hypothetical protein [Streptomyces sp. CBMA156]MBD0674162.1 hypothetical protein [Streptomyces sp. CBMA156]